MGSVRLDFIINPLDIQRMLDIGGTVGFFLSN